MIHRSWCILHIRSYGQIRNISSQIFLILFLVLCSEFDVDMYRKENSCDEFFDDLSKELDLYTKVRSEEKIELITSKVKLISYKFYNK